jgi:hypothetical protein
MPSTECPQCHEAMAKGANGTYCPKCGGIRDRADRQTRFFLRVLPLLVMVFDAPLILYVFLGHAEAPLLAAFGAIAVIPAILVVLVVKGKLRLPSSGKQTL